MAIVGMGPHPSGVYTMDIDCENRTAIGWCRGTPQHYEALRDWIATQLQQEDAT